MFPLPQPVGLMFLCISDQTIRNEVVLFKYLNISLHFVSLHHILLLLFRYKIEKKNLSTFLSGLAILCMYTEMLCYVSRAFSLQKKHCDDPVFRWPVYDSREDSHHQVQFCEDSAINIHWYFVLLKNEARVLLSMVLILSLESSQGSAVAAHRQVLPSESTSWNQNLWNLSLSPELWLPTFGNTDHNINQPGKAEVWSWTAHLPLIGYLGGCEHFSGSARPEVYGHI